MIIRCLTVISGRCHSHMHSYACTVCVHIHAPQHRLTHTSMHIEPKIVSGVWNVS